MIAPGATFSSGRIDVTAGAAQTPNFINQSIGFMNDGSIAVDTDAPTGSNWKNGIRLSAAGAVYGTTTPNSDDVWVSGIRVSTSGRVVYEAAAATAFQNGNPQTANGRLATI